MTIYAGALIPAPEQGEYWSWLSDDLKSFALDQWPYHSSDAALNSLSGTISRQLPVTLDGVRASSGAVTSSYFEDYYHRVHLIPRAIDLGNIIAPDTRQIEVWNAHLTAITLVDIAVLGSAEGLGLTGQPAPPLLFDPLQQRTYTLEVSTAGDPIVDVDYVFDFGTEEPQLSITGRRIVIWSFRPDWSAGITERLTWLTDVLAHYDGTEQRVRLRDHARRSIEYAFVAREHATRLLEALTFGWGGRLYCLPIWWEADVLASTVNAGATSVTVTDAALKDYRAGGFVVLWRDSGVAEAAEILSITGDTLALKSAVTQMFPAGSRVMPAVLARLDGETPYAHMTDRLVQGHVRFEVDGNIDRAAAEIGVTWNGYAVLDERPDRSEDVAETWARTLAILDNLTGIIAVDDTSGAPVIRRTYTWLIQGRAAIDRWKKWGAARAGRLKALWLPTFADDLELVQMIGALEATMRVRNTLSARYVGAHPLRAAVRIELITGQVLHRLVTGITELNDQTEVVAFDTNLGVQVAVSDVRRIMWMGLARLESDAIEMHYETDSIARMQATFRMVSQ